MAYGLYQIPTFSSYFFVLWLAAIHNFCLVKPIKILNLKDVVTTRYNCTYVQSACKTQAIFFTYVHAPVQTLHVHHTIFKHMMPIAQRSYIAQTLHAHTMHLPLAPRMMNTAAQDAVGHAGYYMCVHCLCDQHAIYPMSTIALN